MSAVAMSRRQYTTGFIREAVLDELCEHGHAALTMESIARRSFSSIGSVYARYPNKAAAMNDVLDNVVVPALRNVQLAPGATVLGWVLESHEAFRAINALVEMALYARHCDDIDRAPSILIDTCRTHVKVTGPDGATDDGLQWLVSSVLIGHVVLGGIGCHLPAIDADLDRLVTMACNPAPTFDRRVTRKGELSATVPLSPAPNAVDAVAQSLAHATSEELAEAGMSGANIRRIASRSGVTTGAVYRRYTSKGELVRDALIRELGPHRYRWTDEFIDALAQPGAGHSSGDVLADQMFSLLNDRTKTLSTLEMIHSARTDAHVRETLVSQIEAAAESRAELFRALAEAEERVPVIPPSLMGWVIQLAPAGARVLTALGDPPCEDAVRRALHNVMNSALA